MTNVIGSRWREKLRRHRGGIGEVRLLNSLTYIILTYIIRYYNLDKEIAQRQEGKKKKFHRGIGHLALRDRHIFTFLHFYIIKKSIGRF